MACPAPLKGFKPRHIQSPSALKADKDCRAQWGRGYLEGRRDPDVSYADLPAPPPKAPTNASAVEKKRAQKALKAYNKRMRPALGTAVHAIFEAYYLQKVPGAWHPPMRWVDLAVEWHTRPGQIALSGRQHMPAPEDLQAVWCEELVMVEPVEGWDEPDPANPGWVSRAPWPPLGGTPDLVTLALPPATNDTKLEGGVYMSELFGHDRPGAFHLYDYKTTLSISDYAKTADELLNEDEQAPIYALAVMQRHGLEALDCTWVYMQTAEGPPKSLPVHFHMTRDHAEARVLELAKQAAELDAITQEYIAITPGFLGDGKRLALLQSLPTNDLACDKYAGCHFHAQHGGPCKPAKTPLGSALNAAAKKAKQTTDRKAAVKEAKANGSFLQPTTRRRIATMAMTEAQRARMTELEGLKAEAEGKGEKLKFNLGQELVRLVKLAEAEGGDGAADAPAEEPAPKADPKPVASAPAKPAAAKAPSAPATGGDDLTVKCGDVEFPVPAKSPLYKPLMAAVKGFAAAKAALMGGE